MLPDSHLFLNTRRLITGVLCCVLLAGCKRGQPGAAAPAQPRSNDRVQVDGATTLRFMEANAGLDFHTPNGEEADHYTVVESLGSGLALLDIDGNAELDLWLAGGGSVSVERLVVGNECGVFLQRGGEFSNATAWTRVSRAHTTDSTLYSHGVAVGDWDNDGFPDVLVMGYGRSELFHNRGDGTFAKELPSGWSPHPNRRAMLWGVSGAWGDFNNDGNLDAYVAHYMDWSFQNHPSCQSFRKTREICDPNHFVGLPDQLFVNAGDGSFENDSHRLPANRSDRQAGLGKGLGVIICDLNADGWQDVYVANDTVANFLYLNTTATSSEGVVAFRDASLLSGASRNADGSSDGSMGLDVEDFNNDGLPDIWVTNYESQLSAVYRNEGDAFFEHVSQFMGIAATGRLAVSWGTAWCDLDNDGDLDLPVCNGHVLRHPHNAKMKQLPYLFEHREGRYFNAAPAVGGYFAQPHRGRGMAVGDINCDGRLDLAIAHQNGKARVLRNHCGAKDTHWIALRLVGVDSNRDGIGCRCVLKHLDGNGKMVVRRRLRKGGGSYASTHSPWIHVGLGEASVVKELTVIWPSGASSTWENLRVDQQWILVEGAASPLPEFVETQKRR